MRISPGTRQLQHAALRRLQLGMILLDQPRQLCGTHRRQLHPRIEHTFTLDLPTDIDTETERLRGSWLTD